MAEEEFDPAEMGVQLFSCISGVMSCAGVILAASQVPPPMNMKAYLAAAGAVLWLCICCSLSMYFGAERVANKLDGTD